MLIDFYKHMWIRYCFIHVTIVESAFTPRVNCNSLTWWLSTKKLVLKFFSHDQLPLANTAVVKKDVHKPELNLNIPIAWETSHFEASTYLAVFCSLMWIRMVLYFSYLDFLLFLRSKKQVDAPPQYSNNCTFGVLVFTVTNQDSWE